MSYFLEKDPNRSVPKQLEKFGLADRPAGIGRSPYNFVPAPDRVLYVVSPESLEVTDEQLPPHDRFLDNRSSGYFDIKITLVKPTYTRGPLSVDHKWNVGELSEFDASNETSSIKIDEPEHIQQNIKNKSEFFFLTDPDQRVISSRSIRGLVRSMIEIITYSKLQWVPELAVFYRGFGKAQPYVQYRERLDENKVKAGYALGYRGGWQITPCEYSRCFLGENRLRRDYSGKSPKLLPKSDRRVTRVSFRASGPSEVTVDQNGSDQGWFVMTGHIANKQRQYVFHDPTAATSIPIPDDVVRRFHDEDQITTYQQDVFKSEFDWERSKAGFLPTGKPEGIPGEPVFYINNRNGDVEWLGRARFFRLPYPNRALDYVPEALRKPCGIDIAEALFGFSLDDDAFKNEQAHKGNAVPRQGNRRRSYASRVHFTAAWQTEIEKPPTSVTYLPILSSPKPAANYYLVQRHAGLREAISYCSDTTSNRIRGSKLYWTREGDPESVSVDDIKFPTQHTCVKPAPAGREFKCRMYFENLNETELGAFAWVFALPEGCGLKLGMGKPYGYGAVRVEATLHEDQVADRYDKLFEDDAWYEPVKTRDVKELATKFELNIAQSLNLNGKFRDEYRIECLLRMLDLSGMPSDRQEGSEALIDGRLNAAYEHNLKNFQTCYLPDPLFGKPSGHSPTSSVDSHAVSPARHVRELNVVIRDVSSKGKAIFDVDGQPKSLVPPANVRILPQDRVLVRLHVVAGKAQVTFVRKL